MVDLRYGYIHFSNAEQLRKTASKHFFREDNLILAAVDPDSLGADLKWEPSRAGGLYPHLYGNLSLVDVVWFSPLPVVNGVHGFPESLKDYVDPNRKQFNAFKAFDQGYPIDMLNLVRFREKAKYPIDHELAEMDLSGADAYKMYSSETAPIVLRLGAETVWWGSFESVLIGPESETWDIAFTVRYPSTCVFLEMVTDLEYRRAVIHRQAAVANSRLIRCRSVGENKAFG